MNYDGERLHRPDLARDTPRREFSHYARTYGMGGAPADPVADGVRLGYSVLDEQMRQGQRLAERLGGAGLGGARAGAAPLDMGGLVARALDLYRDMGALALAAAEAVARNPALGAGLRAAAAPASPAAAQAAPAQGFALEIQSSRRIGVKLDWRSGERPAAVCLGPLHAAQGGAKPIADARFDGATLSLKVDDDQPAGTYHGVLVEAASGEAAGTLTVRVPS
jgi:hypothetical protein